MKNEEKMPVNMREGGFSLLATALLIMALGIFTVGGAQLYDVYKDYKSEDITDTRMREIQAAMQSFLAHNGRYPCPAPLDAGLDTAGFGIEVATDCTSGAIAGTERAPGRGGRMVRTGAVPVRTLNLPDSYNADGFGKRYVYAVTEEYAVQGARADGDRGAISIVDGGGFDATSTPGNIIQIVYSMGDDINGAYNTGGTNMQACDTTARSGENCDYNVDATFLNTVNKSTSSNPANKFVHTISYVPPKPIVRCEDTGGINTPKDTAFLVDTSGSMASPGLCPSTMAGCSRIDVARWAMRRIMPAIIYNKGLGADPGQTSMTGFVGYNNVSNVNGNLGNIVFDDPNAPGYVAPDDMTLASTLETELQGMCPSGSTPLGIHIEALADRLGDGTATRPNKIVVISDGISNNGTDPVSIANYVSTTYPNLQVDIVDVVGNISLRQISDTTGGTYYRTDNPDELLNALYSAAGICNAYTPPSVTDQQGCGSSGGWWLGP